MSDLLYNIYEYNSPRFDLYLLMNIEKQEYRMIVLVNETNPENKFVQLWNEKFSVLGSSDESTNSYNRVWFREICKTQFPITYYFILNNMKSKIIVEESENLENCFLIEIKDNATYEKASRISTWKE